MAEQLKRLRVEIDGMWTAAEFAKLFSEMEFLNEMAAFSFIRIDGQTPISPFRWQRIKTIQLNPSWLFNDESDVDVEEYANEMAVRRYLERYMESPPELRVTELRFASPGFGDFLGGGKVIEQIRKFMLGIMDRYLEREDRELEREHKRQIVLKEKIANADRLMKLSDKAMFDDDIKRELVRRVLETDRYLESKWIDGKITKVSEVKDE